MSTDTTVEPTNVKPDGKLPLTSLVTEGNIRLVTPDIKGLTESIKAEGILQPVGIRPHVKDGVIVSGKYDVVYGFRRVAAAKAAGLTEVPIFFVEADDKRRRRLALIENLQRASMTPWEEAVSLQDMITEEAIDQKTVALKLGVTEGFVSQRLLLFKMPKEAQTAIKNGKLDLTQARELYRVREHEDKLKSLLEEVDSLTTSQLKAKIDLFLEKEKAKAEKAEEKKKAKLSGEDPEAGASETEAKPKKTSKKSLAEQYAEKELAPIPVNDLRECLKEYALKMERAKTEEAQQKNKWILKGMEIAAGLSK